MKKILAIFVAFVLLISMTTALADTASDMKDLSNVEIPDYTAYKEEPGKPDEAEKGTITQDSVSIQNNVYDVVTNNGIRLTFTATGNSLALTQDLIRQADLFVSIYKNPVEVVNRWMQNDTHMNIYDADTGVDLYIHVLETSLAAIYPDSTRLSDEEADHLLQFMLEQPRYFKGASEVTCGWIAKNVWLLGDMRDVDGTVTLVGFVAGKEILAYAKIDSEVQYKSMLAHLENLVITGA